MRAFSAGRLPCGLLAATLVLSCAHSGLQEHMANAERVARNAEGTIEEANRMIDGLELDRADALLATAQTQLDDPEMVYFVDREVLQTRHRDAKKRLQIARATKAKDELSARVTRQRQKVEKALAQLRDDLEPLLKREEYSRKHVKSAVDSAAYAAAELEDGKAVEEKDAGYKAWAQNVRKALAQSVAQAQMAEKVLGFLEAALNDRVDGTRLYDEAKLEKKPKKKTSLLEEAGQKFLACARGGAALLKQSPSLEREYFLFQGSRTTTKAFVYACESQVKQISATLGRKITEKPGDKAAEKPTEKGREKVVEKPAEKAGETIDESADEKGATDASSPGGAKKKKKKKAKK